MAGLKPNDFHWIIEGKLAVSECIGGGGLTPRKIRREEEIQWLKGQGINAIFSLLDSDFNLQNYQEVGLWTVTLISCNIDSFFAYLNTICSEICFAKVSIKS